MLNDDDRRLDAAVSLGIITAAQAQAIRDLAPARPAAQLPVAVNAALLGYILGAFAVVSAMAWFLADRWHWLGAGGVIAVSLLYAVIYLAVAQRLRAEGHRVAAGLSVTLAVATVPVSTVALLELLGWFPTLPAGACRYPEFVFWTCRGEELVVELVTVAAALLALQRTRFSLLVLVPALFAVRAMFYLLDVTANGSWTMHASGWLMLATSGLMTAVAYETSRRQPDDVDYALWLHLVAAVTAASTSLVLVNQVEWYRHLLLPASLVAFAFSLRMRRAPWTLLGLGWFVSYLGWLASEVFRDTPFFPIVLAALGIGVIILTVWIQRNSAALVARFGGLASDGRPSFPGGSALMLLPVLVALLQLPSARALDHALWRESEAQQAQFRGRRRAELDSLARVRERPPSETAAPATP